MILNTSITLQSCTNTINAERVKVATFATYRAGVPASVQPATLTEAERMAYGVRGETMRVYLYVEPAIDETFRMVWNGKTYEIRGVNHWRIHTAFLAMPKAGTS